MNALRLTEGVNSSLFSQRTALPLQALHDGLTEARQRGLLDKNAERLAATTQGQLFLNDLLQIFLSNDS